MLGIYCRISKNREGQRSIHLQETEGIEFATKHNLLFEVYIDEGVSGNKDIKDRPALQKLLNDVDDGKITDIYVYHSDRTARNELTWFIIADLVREKSINLYDSGVLIDLNDDSTTMMEGFKAVLNASEWRKTSKKFKDSLLRMVKDGRRFSILPLGYKEGENKKLVVNDQEAEVVKRIYQLSLDGNGTNKIAEILTKEGVPTRYNGMEGTLTTFDRYDKRPRVQDKKSIKWAGNTIRGIIKNTIYKGERYWQGKYYPCPAIVDEFEWQKVNDNLKKNSKNTGVTYEHKYLLKGLLRCGKCGRNYYGRTRLSADGKQPRDHYYMCSSKRIKNENCGNKSIGIDRLDRAIWIGAVTDESLYHRIKHYFQSNTSNEVKTNLEEQISNLNIELKENDTFIQRIIQMVIDGKGLITDDEVNSKMNSLKANKEDLKREIFNNTNQLESLRNMQINETEILLRLSNIMQNTSYNDKQIVLKEFIKDISILYLEEEKTHRITVNYNILELEPLEFNFTKKYSHITFERMEYIPIDNTRDNWDYRKTFVTLEI